MFRQEQEEVYPMTAEEAQKVFDLVKVNAAARRGFDVPPTHFPDALRIGVLVGVEGDEVRLEAHFVDCESCREPALRLLKQVGLSHQAETPALQVSCAQARNALFRYFEQGRELTQAELDHLNACASCPQHFLGPAQSDRYHELAESAP
jgi:hypothetical protein